MDIVVAAAAADVCLSAVQCCLIEIGLLHNQTMSPFQKSSRSLGHDKLL